mgnify:CR=1 FL=1
MLCALVLAGCTGANTSLNTVQLSGAEEAFPADYQARALRYLGEQDRAGIQVSYPMTAVGETAFSARRWYVCLAGLTPPAPPSTRLKPLVEMATDVVRPNPNPTVYHVILILRPGGSTTAIKGFDAPLCADARYEALAAR